MKRGQFTQEQIVRTLQEADKDGKAVASICKDSGITEQTYYRWRRLYGGLDVPEARRLKELESENARLRKLLAECDLEVDARCATVVSKDAQAGIALLKANLG
jgi:putative transposase